MFQRLREAQVANWKWVQVGKRHAVTVGLLLLTGAAWGNDIARRYLVAAVLLQFTLQLLEVTESWPKGRLRVSGGAYLFRGTLCGAVFGAASSAFSNHFSLRSVAWQSLDQALMCYLMGFWVAAATQVAKSSLLIRSFFAAGVMCSAPFYHGAIDLVWQGQPPQAWLVFPAFVGAYGFVFVYGASREKGAPRSFAERLRLTDSK